MKIKNRLNQRVEKNDRKDNKMEIRKDFKKASAGARALSKTY